jgi:hypothetical protein
MAQSRSSARYKLIIRESPAKCRALPSCGSRANKRRKSNDAAEEQEDSPRKCEQSNLSSISDLPTLAHQRGCFHLEPNPVLMLLNDHSHRSTLFDANQNPYLLCTVRLMEQSEDTDEWVLTDRPLLKGLLTHSLQTRVKRILSKDGGPATIISSASLTCCSFAECHGTQGHF